MAAPSRFSKTGVEVSGPRVVKLRSHPGGEQDLGTWFLRRCPTVTGLAWAVCGPSSPSPARERKTPRPLASGWGCKSHSCLSKKSGEGLFDAGMARVTVWVGGGPLLLPGSGFRSLRPLGLAGGGAERVTRQLPRGINSGGSAAPAADTSRDPRALPHAAALRHAVSDPPIRHATPGPRHPGPAPTSHARFPPLLKVPAPH